MKKALFASPTVLCNATVVMLSSLNKTYSDIKYRCVVGIEGLKKVIAFNNKKGIDTFIVKGESDGGYNEETIQALKDSGLRFGMIEKDKEEKWIFGIYNHPKFLSMAV